MCWISLLSPSWDHIIKQWVGCIYVPAQSKFKLKPQLIFGRLIERVEIADENPPFKWMVDCCKPCNISSWSSIVSEIPLKPNGDPGDLWAYHVCDIFCIGINATYKDKGQWEITNSKYILHIITC